MSSEYEPKLPDIDLIRKLTRECGYAVGVHGSQKRDYDLIAAPWTDKAVSYTELIDHLCRGLNAQMRGEIEQKPLGRVAVILQIIDGWRKPIDLSICPKLPTTPWTAEAPTVEGWSAYLIENDGKHGSIRYRTMEQGMIVWTTDPLKALHFCRREDADRFAEEDEDADRILEHKFQGPLSPGGE